MILENKKIEKTKLYTTYSNKPCTIRTSIKFTLFIVEYNNKKKKNQSHMPIYHTNMCIVATLQSQ